MALTAPRGTPPSSAPSVARGLQVRSAKCTGLGRSRTWDAVLVCVFGEGWESPAGSEDRLAAVPHALGMKQWQSLPQRPRQLLQRQSLGQKSLLQPANSAWSGQHCEQTVCGSAPSFPHRHMLEEKNKLPLSKSSYSLQLSCR